MAVSFTLCETVYTGAVAYKGSDYIHLLDDNGTVIAAFDGITNFSPFVLTSGSWTTPTAVDNCHLAVIGEDGVIRKGSHKCSDITPDGGNAATAEALANFYKTRPTSANIEPTGDGGLRKFLCTSSMTEGAPPMESHIIHMDWDTTSGWDAELAVGCGQNKVYARNKKSGTWQEWFNVADGGNADTLDGKHASEIEYNPNILGNAWFGAGVVNSRGLTEYSGAGTCIDEWILTAYSKLVVNDNSVTLSASGGDAYFAYSVPDNGYLTGKTFTASLYLADGTVVTCSGVCPEKTTATQRFANVALPNNIGYLRMYRIKPSNTTSGVDYNVMLTNGNSAEIIAAKLEYGSVATKFVPPNPANIHAYNRKLTTLDEVNNTNLDSGIYSVENVPMAFPSGTHNFFMLIANYHRGTNGYGTQIAIPYTNGNMVGVFYRNATANTWGDWQYIGNGCNAATVNGKTVETNVPANAGFISTGAQTFTGNKTFNGQILPNGATAYGTPQARKLASGTAAATTTNCPSGAWYGQHA